jgi:ElaB/YqjD/DUF883 family membrane-anchored ribosome-binding protein
MLQGLVESVGRGAAQIATGQQAQPAPQQVPQDDTEYVTAGHLRLAQREALNQMSPWLKTVASQQATMAYNLAKREHADIFKKYEPEIIGVLQRVPQENWTLDVIENAVKFTKGNHVDEIAAEKVRALESTLASTMRSTGRAGMGSASEAKETVEASLGKLPETWRAHANAVGITAQQVHEFCFANDMTPDEFFKQFDKGIVTDAVGEMNYTEAGTRRSL